jgi:hypothetical protein
MKRIIFLILLGNTALVCSVLRAQPNSGHTYTGSLEYSIPLLTAVPPLYVGQPTDVTNAYLWADELMRTTQWFSIDRWIWNLGYDDTLTYLAEMLYEVSNDNPLSLYQWEVSGNPNSISQHLSWNYLGHPATEIAELTNQIGGMMPDTGRTGFIIACDLITDVSVSDTIITSNPTDKIIPYTVFVKSTILDEIKGQKVPLCVGDGMSAGRKNKISPLSTYVTPWATYAVAADTGTCLDFEYSPEWQRGIATDAPDPSTPMLSDSTDWWIKPGGEYILFLRLAGVGSDTSNGYFSVQPYWGVFGNNGGVYRVISGHVVDPNDDFGLGASISGGLTVSEWKTRLRARIYNILHP